MELTQLANLGEFIGGLAVLVTLLYLAVQMRNSAREQKTSTLRDATRELGTIIQALGDTEEKAGIWLKGVVGFDTMSSSDRFRFNVVATYFVRLFENIYYQNRDGRIDLEVWSGFSSQIHDFAGYPGVQAWWGTRRHWYGESFRSFLESHMSPDNQPRIYGEPDAAGAPS
jgi:hypothetical protein